MSTDEQTTEYSVLVLGRMEILGLTLNFQIPNESFKVRQQFCISVVIKMDTNGFGHNRVHSEIEETINPATAQNEFDDEDEEGSVVSSIVDR